MKNILLVVDLQPEFKDKDGRYEKILEFVKTSKSKYEYVIATVFENEEGSNFVKYLNWSGCMPPIKELDFDADVVISKSCYGLMDDFEYYFLIDGHSSDTYHYDIIGFDTDSCVLKVALDLFDRGYDINVLTDYCYSSEGLDRHNLGITMLKNLCGSVVK